MEIKKTYSGVIISEIIQGNYEHILYMFTPIKKAKKLFIKEMKLKYKNKKD